MQVVILAGGPARRLRPLSEVVPSPLVEVAGRPFLAWQLDLLRANGIRRVLLCVGHLGYKVKSYFRDGAAFGVEITYSEDGSRLLGTAGALRKALSCPGGLDSAFFVIYGDTYAVVQYPRIWSYFHRFDKPALLVVEGGTLQRTHPDRAAGEEQVVAHVSPTCLVREGFVRRYQPGRPGMSHGDVGVCLLRREVLREIPSGRRVELAWLFDRLARRGDLLALRSEVGHHSIASRAGLVAFRRYIAAMSA